MKVIKTGRGFQLIEFKDRYGVSCSLQQSSLAENSQPGSSAVWFGPNNANPRIIVPGKSWQPIPLPPDTLCDTRAHLDVKMVKKIVSYLQIWLKYGTFTKPKKNTNSLVKKKK